eukprot:TRINITY_DN8009_c0_g1_i3.p1 TRINITY_DN8009_c0_g1~~TRINITY_DN8009_c0_g1_i3.p1  ORF type:complete len:573 (+),score=14.35 TRINITY_DN8009_c0_g1_i3:42-1760(+)
MLKFVDNLDTSIFSFLSPGREISVFLDRIDPAPEGPFQRKLGFSRFTVIVVDADVSTSQCGAVIVPQGLEWKYNYVLAEGRLDLAHHLGFNRLFIVYLNRGHLFDSSYTDLQRELGPTLSTLIPQICPSKKARFINVQKVDPVGKRRIVSVKDSAFSGRLVVEDVVDYTGANGVDGQQYQKRKKGQKKNRQKETQPFGRVTRRLFFLADEGAIQSEVFINYPSTAAAIRSFQEDTKEDGVLDFMQLPFEYHQAMIAAMSFLSPLLLTVSEPAPSAPHSSPVVVSVLLVGLGGGTFAIGLPTCFSSDPRMDAEEEIKSNESASYRPIQIEMEALELDETVAEVAQNCFGYNQKAIICDGLVFIDKLHRQIQLERSGPLSDTDSAKDVIVLDVDHKDLEADLFPPPQFLEADFLRQVQECLKPGGIMVMNYGSLKEVTREFVRKRVRTVFDYALYEIPVEDDQNRILIGLRPFDSPRLVASTSAPGSVERCDRCQLIYPPSSLSDCFARVPLLRRLLNPRARHFYDFSVIIKDVAVICHPGDWSPCPNCIASTENVSVVSDSEFSNKKAKNERT